jgi:nicotinate-nucleotide pyrophosphorylase (carboxylating)
MNKLDFNNKTQFLKFFIDYALMEDQGDGDHTSLACVGAEDEDTAILKVKDEGILAGVELMEHFRYTVKVEHSFWQNALS